MKSKNYISEIIKLLKTAENLIFPEWYELCLIRIENNKKTTRRK